MEYQRYSNSYTRPQHIHKTLKSVESEKLLIEGIRSILF